MEIFLADSNHDIVAVCFDHFDLRDVEYMQVAAKLGQKPRSPAAKKTRAPAAKKPVKRRR